MGTIQHDWPGRPTGARDDPSVFAVGRTVARYDYTMRRWEVHRYPSVPRIWGEGKLVAYCATRTEARATCQAQDVPQPPRTITTTEADLLTIEYAMHMMTTLDEACGWLGGPHVIHRSALPLWERARRREEEAR